MAYKITQPARGFGAQAANLARFSLPGFCILLLTGWWPSESVGSFSSNHRGAVNHHQDARGDGASWVPLRIVDVSKVPLGTPFGGLARVLYKNEKDGKLLGHLLYIDWPPSGIPQPRPGQRLLGPHYHPYHEWGYILGGDYITYEMVHPGQKQGEIVQHRTGDWLDRPAYSIHDGEGRPGSRYRQGNCDMLLFEEGDGPKDDVAFDPQSPRYKPDWKNVTQWTHPHRVQAVESMEWEADPDLPGTTVKYLSEDQVMGFRARLHFAPAGWSYAKAPERSYYKQAHRFVYVIWGDLAAWVYNNPDAPGTKVVATRNFLIDQAPMSIWGVAQGPLTEKGCMWLEVMYAKGAQVGGGRLEEPTALK